jgi:hypothetical protein
MAGELGFTRAAITGRAQGDRAENQLSVRDDPDC